MRTLLVTGGAGFIGSNFVLHMLRRYPSDRLINLDKLTYAGNLENLREIENHPNYSFVQGDIGDRELVERIFEAHPVDYVVNFAAESHVDRSITDPELFVRTNVLGTSNLLNVAKKYWLTADGREPGTAKKFLQVSTDEVYGSLGETGYFTEATPLDPHSPYSASKAGADLLVKAYYDTFGLPVNITRCSNNYGPYQFPEKLIPLMINNALNQKPLPVYGDGLNIRDWLYVEDHCQAIDLVLHNGRVGEVYNIGGHNERTNIVIVKTIIQYLHENVNPEIDERLIKYVEDRKGHDRRYGIDPAKIKEELGWYPETSFEDGIIKTIGWYIENKAWMDNVTSGEYREYYRGMYEGR
jgi:dTDP-glucose 4,6-dehydratase